MEYFLESLDLQKGSYTTFEGTLIQGFGDIQCLVGKIVETVATMLPNRDFVVGLVERVARILPDQ